MDQKQLELAQKYADDESNVGTGRMLVQALLAERERLLAEVARLREQAK